LDDSRYTRMAVIEENSKEIPRSIDSSSKLSCQLGTGRENFLDDLIARRTGRREEARELGKINIPLAADFGYILRVAELPTRLASVSPICKMGMTNKIMEVALNQFGN
jgi:hypothetical protein